jgi:hypothetical protein
MARLGEYEWIADVVGYVAPVVQGVVTDVNKTKQAKIKATSDNYIASLASQAQTVVSELPPYVIPVAIGLGILLVGGFIVARK